MRRETRLEKKRRKTEKESIKYLARLRNTAAISALTDFFECPLETIISNTIEFI